MTVLRYIHISKRIMVIFTKCHSWLRTATLANCAVCQLVTQSIGSTEVPTTLLLEKYLDILIYLNIYIHIQEVSNLVD